MPNVPKTPLRAVRLDDVWDDLKVAVPVLGAADRSAYIRQCVEWGLRRPGVRQPKRLTEDQARELFGEPASD